MPANRSQAVADRRPKLDQTLPSWGPRMPIPFPSLLKNCFTTIREKNASLEKKNQPSLK
jgi:hypothetical protein